MPEERQTYEFGLEKVNLDDLLALLKKEETKQSKKSRQRSQESLSTRELILRLIDRVQRV